MHTYPAWPRLPPGFFFLMLVGVAGLEASAPYWAVELPESLLLRGLQLLWILGCVGRLDLWLALGICWPEASDMRLFVITAVACTMLSVALLALPLGLLERVSVPTVVASGSGLLLFLLLGPMVEELFFRAYVYGFLRQSFGIPLSVAVSSLAFAQMHGAWAVPQLAGGIVFALAYEFSRKLWVPMGLHIGANTAVLLVACFNGSLPGGG
ncbi:MAG: CPBP family intramembrane glutamic endopeptidase [Mariprofundaceae bacterium]